MERTTAQIAHLVGVHPETVRRTARSLKLEPASEGRAFYWSREQSSSLLEHFYQKRLPRPKKLCSVPGCHSPSRVRGWCPMHWERWRRSGTTEERPLVAKGRRCIIPGCEEPVVAAGQCRSCYGRWWRELRAG